MFRVDKKDIYKFGTAGALGYGLYYSLESIGGAVTTLPICIFNGNISEIVELSTESIIMVITFSIFCLGIQQLTYVYVISKLSVTSSAIIINLLPFAVVVK